MGLLDRNFETPRRSPPCSTVTAGMEAISLVPKLGVGMLSGTLRVLTVCPGDPDDAERRRRHSHAERGNETGRRAGGDRRGVSKLSLYCTTDFGESPPI